MYANDEQFWIDIDLVEWMNVYETLINRKHKRQTVKEIYHQINDQYFDGKDSRNTRNRNCNGLKNVNKKISNEVKIDNDNEVKNYDSDEKQVSYIDRESVKIKKILESRKFLYTIIHENYEENIVKQINSWHL